MQAGNPQAVRSAARRGAVMRFRSRAKVLVCRCAQMIDHMMANALGQVEQAVDDELERIENFTVRALSASPSAAHSADACESALASIAPPPPGSPPPCPCLRARCPRRTHT